MNKIPTAYLDKNGKRISLGGSVLLGGEIYEVIINDFNGVVVVDSDLGQSPLFKVNKICEVIE